MIYCEHESHRWFSHGVVFVRFLSITHKYSEISIFIFTSFCKLLFCFKRVLSKVVLFYKYHLLTTYILLVFFNWSQEKRYLKIYHEILKILTQWHILTAAAVCHYNAIKLSLDLLRTVFSVNFEVVLDLSKNVFSNVLKSKFIFMKDFLVKQHTAKK